MLMEFYAKVRIFFYCIGITIFANHYIRKFEIIRKQFYQSKPSAGSHCGTNLCWTALMGMQLGKTRAYRKLSS